MQTFPNITSRFIDNAGKVVKPWIQYLQQFTRQPPNAMAVSVSGFPVSFSFTAAEPGQLVITGTVSKINLIRGTTTVEIIGTNIISLSVNDTVQISYTSPPKILFFPSYGANTNS